MNLEEAKQRIEVIVRQYGISLPPERVREIFSLVRDLIAEVERLEELRSGLLQQNLQQEQEIEELQTKVCGMRKALAYLADENHWDEEGGFYKLQRPGRGGQAGIFLFSRNLHPWLLAQEALRSTPTCPHKEEAEKLREELAVGEAGGRLLKAIQEKTEAEVATLKAHAIVVRFDGPPGLKGGRFVEVETLDGKSIEVGEWKPDGQYWLLVIPGLNRVAALQAALDEANGRVMEAEFKLECAEIAATLSDSVEPLQPLAGDPRHLWSRERWTEEARKAKEK